MDLVSDALTRIKNGYLAQKTEVLLPYSKLIKHISELLQKEGFIKEFSEEKLSEGSSVIRLKAVLKYDGKKAAVTDVKRISKPGLRVYKGNKSIPHVLNGLGIAIISTPKGVMSDKQARKAGVGGEVLAYIW